MTHKEPKRRNWARKVARMKERDERIDPNSMYFFGVGKPVDPKRSHWTAMLNGDCRFTAGFWDNGEMWPDEIE